MLRKFAAGVLVASCMIPIGAVVVFGIRLATGVRYYQMAVMWCTVPLLWGVWAMLIPQSWTPKRIPLWGAILGVLAAILGAVVMNLPARITQLEFGLGLRWFAIVPAACLYYLAWMIVAWVYAKLAPLDTRASTAAKPA